MSFTYISSALRRLVRERARYRCEYCLVHEDDVLVSHQCDHIIAEQHGGETDAQNLALACIHCNRKKGSNIASLDPQTKQLVPLYNPRIHDWQEHFHLQNAYIQPQTPIGRATVSLLGLNDTERTEGRTELVETGRYP